MISILKFDILKITPIGSKTATSTSKIKKIRVVIKNRRENVLRAFLKGENPHSKGVIFSWEIIDFSLIKIFRNSINIGMAMAIIIKGANVNIKSLINK